MEVNGLLDIPTKDLIYIYKISSKYTGHYYIGQTGSMEERMSSHMAIIMRLIDGGTCVPQKFHKTVVVKINELFQQQQKKKLKLQRFVRESLSVYVLALVADKETANVVERHYISKGWHDGLCTNVREY